MMLRDRHLPQSRAVDLALPSPTIHSDATNAVVLEVFGQHPDLTTLPVLENQRPIGMIKRHLFMSELAKPFHREVYERKRCTAFMDGEPVIVEADTSIDDTALAIVESGGKALTDGFLVARGGDFVGIGSGLDLMRAVASQQAERNRQIMQSIDYASVIQRAMLRPSQEALAETLPDAALAWQPRDVVGGDFYHFAPYPDGWFFLLADCTGHGVPGAFMTLISSSWLARILEQAGPRDPARLLGELNRRIKTALAQTETQADGSDDGLDAIALWFDRANSTLRFAGSRIPLHLLAPDADTVRTFETERRGLGYVGTPMDQAWTNHELAPAPGSIICLASDGLIDQIGGARHLSFGKRRLREAMTSQPRDLPMQDYANALLDVHAAYQEGHARRDDLTLFCFRIPSQPAP